MRENVKGFILDVFVIGIVLVVLMMVYIMYSLLWVNTNAYINKTNLPNLSPYQFNVIKSLGNGYFLNTPDTILVFFYFILIIAAFISAHFEAANALTLPLGLPILIVAVLVAMPISDFAHSFLVNPALNAVNIYYKGTLYILDNLPVFTALGTLGYIIFVMTHKSGPTFGNRVVTG